MANAEYRAILDRTLARFRALSRDIAANLHDDVPEEARFKLAFKDFFDGFGRFYNDTYDDLLVLRTTEEQAHNFDTELDGWRQRYQEMTGLDPSNPSESESDPYRQLRLLGWGVLGIGALFGVGWLVSSVVKGAVNLKPTVSIGDDLEAARWDRFDAQDWARDMGATLSLANRGICPSKKRIDYLAWNGRKIVDRHPRSRSMVTGAMKRLRASKGACEARRVH